MTRQQFWFAAAIAMIVATSAVRSAQAELLAFDSFESYQAGSELDGGADGTGWTDAWFSELSVTVEEVELSFGGQSGGAQSAMIGGEDFFTALNRPYEPVSDTVYMGMLVRADWDESDFVQLQVSDGVTGNEVGTMTIGIDTREPMGFFTRINRHGAPNTSFSTGAEFFPETDYFLVGKFSKDGGSDTYNRVDLFVDPPSTTEPDIPDATKEDVDSTIDQLSMFTVRTALQEIEDSLYIDELRIATSFAEALMGDGVAQLQAGDADQDLKFDQLDLVQVQIAAKYLSGQAATWGEGDWDGAPGGSQGNPPAGNGMFDQLDIIAALAAGTYLTGPYAAVADDGQMNDGQTSIVYNPASGELAVDAPVGAELTSINIDSASAIFTGDAAANLGGSFDNDADNNIFKATFGSSFGLVSFGNVAQRGLSEEFLLGDLTAVGSLAGGGDLGNVDLVYVPEPSTIGLFLFGLLLGLVRLRHTHV